MEMNLGNIEEMERLEIEKRKTDIFWSQIKICFWIGGLGGAILGLLTYKPH